MTISAFAPHTIHAHGEASRNAMLEHGLRADRIPTLTEYNLLRSSVGWRIHPDEVAELSLAASINGVVATKNGQVVGMARAVGDSLYVFIVDVVVHSDHRGAGIGKRLVNQLRDNLRREHPPLVGLIANEELSTFYQECGFEPSLDSYFRAT